MNLPVLKSFRMSFQMKAILFVLVALGVVALHLMRLQDEQRAWSNYLIGATIFLGMGLFGLFFTAIQFVTSARWSVGVRRVMEAMAMTLPIAALLFWGVYYGHHHIYEWAQGAGNDVVMQGKSPFLNSHAFGLRIVIYFSIWIVASALLLRNSFRQDKSADVSLSRLNFKLAAVILVAFALSVSLAGFDFLMSIEPHWFSTIFGIYFFAGFFQAGLVIFYLLTYILYKKGVLTEFISEDHFHDIARFIFAFSIFWAYIGFAQYMLIWYGDLPEETAFYRDRMLQGWGCMGLTVLFLRFVLPFLILLPFNAKRCFKLMLAMCGVLLLGHWLDLYWIVMPALRLVKGTPSVLPAIGWKELAVGLGFISLFVLLVGFIMERIRMVPMKDPRLEASIHYYHH